jgi:hypothetical protein
LSERRFFLFSFTVKEKTPNNKKKDGASLKKKKKSRRRANLLVHPGDEDLGEGPKKDLRRWPSRESV